MSDVGSVAPSAVSLGSQIMNPVAAACLASLDAALEQSSAKRDVFTLKSTIDTSGPSSGSATSGAWPAAVAGGVGAYGDASAGDGQTGPAGLAVEEGEGGSVVGSLAGWTDLTCDPSAESVSGKRDSKKAEGSRANGEGLVNGEGRRTHSKYNDAKGEVERRSRSKGNVATNAKGEERRSRSKGKRTGEETTAAETRMQGRRPQTSQPNDDGDTDGGDTVDGDTVDGDAGGGLCPPHAASAAAKTATAVPSASSTAALSMALTLVPVDLLPPGGRAARVGALDLFDANVEAVVRRGDAPLGLVPAPVPAPAEVACIHPCSRYRVNTSPQPQPPHEEEGGKEGGKEGGEEAPGRRRGAGSGRRDGELDLISLELSPMDRMALEAAKKHAKQEAAKRARHAAEREARHKREAEEALCERRRRAEDAEEVALHGGDHESWAPDESEEEEEVEEEDEEEDMGEAANVPKWQVCAWGKEDVVLLQLHALSVPVPCAPHRIPIVVHVYSPSTRTRSHALRICSVHICPPHHP